MEQLDIAPTDEYPESRTTGEGEERGTEVGSRGQCLVSDLDQLQFHVVFFEDTCLFLALSTGAIEDSRLVTVQFVSLLPDYPSMLLSIKGREPITTPVSKVESLFLTTPNAKSYLFPTP